MKKTQPLPSFADFLVRMIRSGKLSREMLPELIGLENANILLDNANNEKGAPQISGGHIPILHGQIHEILGSIPDIKARLAMVQENIENQTNEQIELEEQQSATPKPS